MTVIATLCLFTIAFENSSENKKAPSIPTVIAPDCHVAATMQVLLLFEAILC